VRYRVAYLFIWVLLMVGALMLLPEPAFAHAGHDEPEPPEAVSVAPASADAAYGPQAINAACDGGPTLKGGTVLDECFNRSFSVGGVTKTIRVWYTKDATAVDHTEDGVDYSLQHWINSDAQAQQVAEWFENAWRRFHTDSGHHLYDTGCSNRVNVRLEDGIGWAGIAYWASSGNCWIGIDSPLVRNGGGERTVYHEAQHYLQYSYDDGCYGHFQPNYSGNSEFIEGYADLGSDTVNATVDAQVYAGIGYDSSTSMYAKSYRNIFNKYFVEQLGSYATAADPWHNIDALYAHYAACDAADNLNVLDSLIPSLSGGKWTQNRFFLNFFAANWAHTWADPATQPELVYLDDDDAAFGTLANLTQNETISGGNKHWSGAAPEDYTATYYQVQPQSGCPYVQVEVDGEPGAQLGINLMAAKTSAPSSVLRSAVIGEDFVRTFAGAGAHDRIVAAVNSFAATYSYDVDFTCVTPVLDILEPRQASFVLVGDPSSPIAFLARWSVRDGASSVRGLPASSFTFFAGPSGGDPITLVEGSFQEVGDEYWATLLPPTKPAGTTFSDFTICLDGTLCDSETNALLYVEPGSTDIALSFDASGSMGIEDTTGEGTRLDNAKRSGQVIADLLRPGDRIVVQDWSAHSCSGDNCTLDVRTLVSEASVTEANVVSVVTNARSGINNISARNRTPLGAGVQAAKDALVSLPGDDNPKHVFLLSDGAENVFPFYADVRNEIIDSGVVVNTIGFGPEAPGNLLAQIAGDTGGTYRPVATTISGAGMASAASSESAEALSALAALETPLEAQQVLDAPVPPGQLGLADVYDYLDTEAQGASRIMRQLYQGVPAQTERLFAATVDSNADELRFVIAGKQPDDGGACNSSERRVWVLRPGGTDKDWIAISPPDKDGNLPPADWVIRNNRFDDTLIVPNPQPGQWRFRAVYNFCVINAAGEETDQVAAPVEAQFTGPYDFLMTASVQSAVQLQGRLLGLESGQGVAGDVVTIAGNLLDKSGIYTPTGMVAQVQGPSGSFLIVMKDDGENNDGSKEDGIYGARFGYTIYGGGYDVRILAGFKDPDGSGRTAIREWNGGFWIDGPRLNPQGVPTCGGENDKDNDCMPDDWEERCKLDTTRDDRKEDPDGDGLINWEELQQGTLPCRADTDNGGENDGSEVRNDRNPLDPSDDQVRPFDRIHVRPLNGRLLIDWTRPFSYTNMRIYVSTDSNNPGQPINAGTGEGDDKIPGNWLVTGLENGRTYTVWLQGENGNALGDMSEAQTAMPKEDTDPPSGAILIENGKPQTPSPQVMLHISSTDIPLEGAAQSANAHMTDQLSLQFNTVSGSAEMRISNHIDMQGAVWEPLQPTKPWTLDCEVGEQCTVYAQFRDVAQNESMTVWDTILLVDPSTADGLYFYLPVIRK